MNQLKVAYILTVRLSLSIFLFIISEKFINCVRIKSRKVGDDFHEHLEAMMYEEEEDEEMEAQSFFQYISPVVFEQPAHHFNTQPPNVVT